MVKVLRSVLAIVLGLFAGFLAVGAGEMIGHHVYPPPPGLDFHDADSAADAMKRMPAGAFVPILLAWAVGTFAGAWVATKVAAVGKVWHGMAIGGVFFAATVAIMLHIPHPAWVMVVGLVSLLPVAYFGSRLATPNAPISEHA